MSHRPPILGPLVVLGLTGAGLVAIVGGLALRGPGLVAVGVAGALAACLGWGTARESTTPSRRSNAETALLAAAWTVGALLVISGTSVLAGGVTAAALAGAAAVVAVAIWVARTPKNSARPLAAPPTRHGNLTAPPSPLRAVGAQRHPTAVAGKLPPVGSMTTEELGREWLQGTTALTGRLDPTVRAAIVLRRQEALDELERRDPDGFLRWLTAGTVLDRDPAPFVRGRRTLGESAAGTDAA